ncbi:conserved hypothetical protein [Gloeothece citriformis PCC 7424]|uniref:Uncharacterized protein n=1 Tax=Gloeothece citriformis (strain PCC 7424) TaxID=65393 RepID=B7KJ07_GLOC7|nr:hypothetical protein [Gloeothece citriformis]ACK70843.1 conserved hypothetical protein [Gloeothece citriformis PCC 7424]
MMLSNTVAKSSTLVTAKQHELGKIEKLMQDVRKMPLFRQLVPLEAGVGWPIPLRKDSKVYITLPFYGCTPQKGQTLLFPPFATLTLNWANLIPVEYVNLRFRNPAPDLKWEGQVGIFPHAAVKQITIKEYKEKRQELLSMYDEMFNSLTGGIPFSSEWCARFSQLLRLLIEPCLEPYYRILGEKFFARFLPK